MYKGKYVTALIAAAGMGNRMNSNINKPYIYLDDRPVLAHTIERFEKCRYVDEIIVIAREEEINYCKHRVVKKYRFKKVKKIIRGGQERQDSVYNGILALNNKTDIVISHDGARPFVSHNMIINSLDETYKKGASIVGVPVIDTIKVIEGEKDVIDHTPKRSLLWAAQTPQTFKIDILREAYENAIEENFVGTDDSSLVERMGHEVSMVMGNYSNIKLTTQEDLILAKSLMENEAVMRESNIRVQSR